MEAGCKIPATVARMHCHLAIPWTLTLSGTHLRGHGLPRGWVIRRYRCQEHEGQHTASPGAAPGAADAAHLQEVNIMRARSIHAPAGCRKYCLRARHTTLQWAAPGQSRTQIGRFTRYGCRSGGGRPGNGMSGVVCPRKMGAGPFPKAVPSRARPGLSSLGGLLVRVWLAVLLMRH